MRIRDTTNTKQSGNDWNMRFLGKLPQFVISFRQNNSMTRHNHRALCSVNQLGRLSNNFCRWLRYAASTRCMHICGRTWQGRRTIECFGKLDIFRYIYQDGAGTPTPRNVEGFVDDFREVFNVAHKEIVL